MDATGWQEKCERLEHALEDVLEGRYCDIQTGVRIKALLDEPPAAPAGITPAIAGGPDHIGIQPIMPAAPATDFFAGMPEGLRPPPEPCPNCNGSNSDCEFCAGSGTVTPATEEPMHCEKHNNDYWEADGCNHCFMEALKAAPATKPDSDDTCGSCGGYGHVAGSDGCPVDCRICGGTGFSPEEEPDHGEPLSDEVIAALVAHHPMEPAAEEPCEICCVCGKAVSTAEDGGPECELEDGRWVCSRVCYDAEQDRLATPCVRCRRIPRYCTCPEPDAGSTAQDEQRVARARMQRIVAELSDTYEEGFAAGFDAHRAGQGEVEQQGADGIDTRRSTAPATSPTGEAEHPDRKTAWIDRLRAVLTDCENYPAIRDMLRPELERLLALLRPPYGHVSRCDPDEDIQAEHPDTARLREAVTLLADIRKTVRGVNKELQRRIDEMVAAAPPAGQKEET